MMRICLFFCISLLLLGCSSKNEKEFRSLYNKQKIHSKTLQKTEKIQLYDASSITKVLLTATYISKIDINKKNKEDEMFIMGLYTENNETEESTLEHFSLMLNGKKYKSIKALKENSKLLKSIPFVFSWTQFYVVNFSHETSKHMKLDIQHILHGKGTAYFSKVAKYISKKKVF
ncbi:MAG: hypothetical protein L3J43_05380 [Sulfurovum sp.]|nr:hypothetical protein [Sulfurovum sp.]